MAEDDEKDLDKDIDLIEMIAPAEPPATRRRQRTPRGTASFLHIPETGEDAEAQPAEGRLEVRPIGTPIGLRELAGLHRKTWTMLNVEEKRVHMMLWPLALHFGLYQLKPGQERR